MKYTATVQGKTINKDGNIGFGPTGTSKKKVVEAINKAKNLLKVKKWDKDSFVQLEEKKGGKPITRTVLMSNFLKK